MRSLRFQLGEADVQNVIFDDGVSAVVQNTIFDDGVSEALLQSMSDASDDEVLLPNIILICGAARLTARIVVANRLLALPWSLGDVCSSFRGS